MSVKAERVATGHYRINTKLGVFQVVSITASGSYPAGWFITWPGRSHPDEVTDTLKDAKAIIASALD